MRQKGNASTTRVTTPTESRIVVQGGGKKEAKDKTGRLTAEVRQQQQQSGSDFSRVLWANGCQRLWYVWLLLDSLGLAEIGDGGVVYWCGRARGIVLFVSSISHIHNVFPRNQRMTTPWHELTLKRRWCELRRQIINHLFG